MTNKAEQQPSAISRIRGFFAERLAPSPERKQAKLRKETLNTLIDYVVVPTLENAVKEKRGLSQGEGMYMIFEMRSARLLIGIQTAEVENDPRVAPLLRQVAEFKVAQQAEATGA